MPSRRNNKPGPRLQYSVLPHAAVAVAALPMNKPFFDLANPGLILVIWDVLIGIPFSLFIATFNKAFMQWLGYEKIMRCPSGIFASRLIMVLVNLWIIWSWRRQLVQEQWEEKTRAEIMLLDEIIARLEGVLARVQAMEIEEQLESDITHVKGEGYGQPRLG